MLQTLNIIYSSVNGVLLYLICKNIFKEEKVQKLSLIFITFFSLYWAFFNTHIYGNIPGLTFALLAVLFTTRYLDNKKFYNLPIIGAFLTIAYLLKSNYEIFLCSIIITILLNIINTKKAKDLLGVILIIVMVFGSKTLIYKISEKAFGYSLDTGVPMTAYIYMGISEPDTLAAGWYNSKVEEIYKNSGYNTEEATKITNDLLKKRIEELKNDPEYTVNYFYSKFQTTWLNPTFQTLWCSLPNSLMNEDADYGTRISSNPLIEDVLCGDIYIKIENLMDLFENTIFIFAGIGLIFLLAKFDLKNIILPLTFLGGLLFHLIWETKSIYVIQYFFVLLPVAAFGMYKIFEFIDKILDKALYKTVEDNKKVRLGVLIPSIIVILVILVVATYFVSGNKEERFKEEMERVKTALSLTEANYIWNNTNDDNTWMCFRKKVTLEEDEAEKVIAKIGVDSKYWLYINGELVIRDGGLKRGEKKDSIYYDEVDLSQYFKPGENTIAILAWYWGGQSFSHISSGQAGMFFEAEAGSKLIITDDTWKVKKYDAFGQDGIKPNYRMIEYNVYYDARMGNDDWYKVDFDDSNWEMAKVLNVKGEFPWGELIKREIPQFKNGEIKEYENMSEYAGKSFDKQQVIAMKLPYNMQFTPYLKVEATSGLEINVQTDTYDDPSGVSLRSTYITRDGVQEFESLSWINGEIAYYTIPAGVKVISLGYRETGYDTEFVGSFESDNEFFNKLWLQARRTLYVNMRDSYMDCPNRERAQWVGDMNIEMLQAMYSLDTKSYPLYEKGINTMIGWRDEGVFYSVSPNNLEPMHLPVQNLGGIVAMYEYYEYTGKKDFLEEVYPAVKDYLNLWKINDENNLIEWNSGKGRWQWGDSVEDVDYIATENAWYYYAMSKAFEMAKILDQTEDEEIFMSKLDTLNKGFNALWTDKGYKTAESKIIDERANAVAVLAGLANIEKYPVITDILKTDYQATPFTEKYVLEALCKIGKYSEAQDRIKIHYSDMVEGENAKSTLWEHWDYERGTKNHAWSGGPLIIMSKYFAGIEPLKPGYEEISISPNFGNLSKISSSVETIKGKITLEATKSNDKIELTVNVPAKAFIKIPKLKNETLKVDGKITNDYGKDENWIGFYVEAGEHKIETGKIQ